jgi:hypothetical protein
MHETCWREAKDRHSKLMNGRQIRGKKTFTLRSVFVNSPPPKPEVILTNFFAEPTVLLVLITSRVLFLQNVFFPRIWRPLDRWAYPKDSYRTFVSATCSQR